MKLTLITIVILITNSICHGENAKPMDLLKSIHDLSIQKNYKQIKNHIYPFALTRDVSSRDAAIFYIKAQDIKHTGDYSYSDKAVSILLNNKNYKFVLADKKVIEDFRGYDDSLKLIDDSHFMTLKPFKGNRVNVVIVKVKNDYLLLFWEGLNHLLPIEETIKKANKSQ